MNQADKAEALQWIARILHLTRPTIELDNLRALIERQPDDTDGERWRFCAVNGFPVELAGGKWVSSSKGKLPCADTPNEAVDVAIAAMKEKA